MRSESGRWAMFLLSSSSAFADMYAYNSDGNKFIRRFLREDNLKPLGLEENPSDTIKWTLGNLLNKMEGKPQI